MKDTMKYGKLRLLINTLRKANLGFCDDAANELERLYNENIRYENMIDNLLSGVKALKGVKE